MSSSSTTPAHDLRKTIFIKTAMGRAEVTARGATLKSRQRSVLIMLDGRKCLEDIAGFSAEDVEEAIRHLLALELIAPLQPEAPDTTPGTASGTAPVKAPVKAPDAAPPQVPALPAAVEEEHLADTPALADIKALMTDSAHTYLGPMASSLVARVGRARNKPELLALVGHWHMALRDSKYGRDAAGLYLERVRSRFDAVPG